MLCEECVVSQVILFLLMISVVINQQQTPERFLEPIQKEILINSSHTYGRKAIIG